MANPLDAWMQVPTSVLDLGQRTADADAWAQQQRAKIAETWANTQRQAVSTMATTWQQGMDSVDHFADGFGSATPTQQPPQQPLGYNDMTGADTSPQGPLSSLQGQPEGIQAAGTPQSTSLPEALNYGAGQASNEANNLRNTVVTQVNNVADQYNYAFKPTIGTRGDQPGRAQVIGGSKMLRNFTPEQLASQQEQGFNAVLGVTPGENVAGETSRFFHGTGSDFPRPTADKFDPNGLFGPGYYLTSDPRVASSYSYGGGSGENIVRRGKEYDAAVDKLRIAKEQAASANAELDAHYRANPNGTFEDRYPIRQKLERAQSAVKAAEIDAAGQEQIIKTQTQPNVRAVNVPNDLNLLDAETWPGQAVEDRIKTAVYQKVGDRAGDNFVESLGAGTGLDIWQSLGKAVQNDKAQASQLLQSVGYDGIQYAGGKRIPMSDATGSPIEHTAVVIFPNEQSLGKLTNAISGTKFGSSPTIGGALVGGYAGSQQGDTPEERARNAALGAVSGAVGGHLLGRLGAGKNVDVGLSIKADTPAPGMVRMYRGEPNLANRATVSETSRVGRWFTPDLNEAHQYGRDTYGDMSKVFSVDVPASEVDKFKVQTSTGEVGYNLPSEYAGQAAEVPPPTAGSPTTNGVPSEPGRAGNILLKKYVDPEVQDVIAEAAAHDPNAMEEARRGVVSDATVQQLADAAGVSVQKVIDRWKPGDIQNAETIQAMRIALSTKADEVLAAQRAVQQGGNSSENLLKLQITLKEHQAVQEAVSGVSAELGRGLRALRSHVSSAITSGDSAKMEDLLRKLGGRQFTEDIATKLGQLDINDPTQITHFLRDMAKPNAQQRLSEYWYNSILSSPSTHVANFSGNTISSLLGPFERGVSAAIEVPMAAITHRPRERFFGETPAAAFGILQGLPDGLRGAAYVMKHGFSFEDALKGEVRVGQAIRGPVGNALNVPSRMLGASDALFRGVMYRSNLNAEAFRMAAKEGLSGAKLGQRVDDLLANPPVDLMNRAGKLTNYGLYRQEPDQIAKAMQAIRGITVKGTSFQPMRFVIPFIQTPVNLTKFGLERSPAGMGYAVGKTIATKGSAEASDQLARALPATIVAGAIGSLVGTGKMDITGAAPKDPAKRDAFYRQGKLPFSLRFGSSPWYSYQRWEPFNQGLAQVAAVVDAVRDAKSGASPTEIGSRAVFTIAQNVASQTYLSGINSLIQAVTEPERYANQFVQQLAGGMVPMSGAMRTAANLVDPRQRQASGITEAVESNIPGLSQNVPPRLNNYGEEQTQPGNPLIPYKWQTANDSPLETELARLKVEPGATGKTLRGIDLTRQENADYQRLSGGLVKASLTQLLQDPRYAQSDDIKKAKALEYVITHAKDAAAQQYINQLVASQGKNALMQRIQQKKLSSLGRAS